MVVVMMNRRELISLVLTGIARSATIPQTVDYRAWERRYRVNAAILFCGVQIFSRSGVGSGYAVAEELRRAGGAEIALQFAGGSWPDQAHGVNRLGFFQESVTERGNGETAGARYFGFMTSSTEKNFEQARQSFAEKTAKPVGYVAAQGGRSRFAVHRMLFPSSYTWADCPALTREVRAAVSHSSETWQEAAGANGAETFLNAMRKALLDRSPKTHSLLTYNGTLFELTAEKQVEAGGLTRLNGTLRHTVTGQRTPFRLWYEASGGNYLPVRIEYRAKPFLKLVFEADAEARRPEIAFFLNKENS